MKNEELRRLCLYALPPYKMGLCGPQKNKQTIQETMKRLIDGTEIRERDIKNLKRFFTEFNALHDYLSKLAILHNSNDSFEGRFINTYWLGGELLDSFFSKHRDSDRDRKQDKIPFHNYHVLSVGSLSREFDVGMRRACMISWGKVVNKYDSGAINIAVETRPLIRALGWSLDDYQDAKVEWDKKIVPALNAGEYVSIHWNKILEVITYKQAKMLEKYTLKSLDTINR
ncbi:MAG: DUF6390 family protein [bacterium]